MNPRRQTEPNTISKSPGNAERYLWIVFFATLALFVLGLKFPEQRLWGVGQWAHFPSIYPPAALIAAALLAILARWTLGRSESAAEPQSPASHFLYFSLALLVVLGAAFYLLRARIHFLGDGYTLLANLATDEPIIKMRNLGETLARQFIYSQLGGDNAQRSLTAYRIASISGGVIFAISVVVCARQLFATIKERVLFSLGLLSGGYMLLFFGYAEHYCLFVPTVGLFGLSGLLIARGRLNRLWIIVPLGISVFLHVFGVILIPAAVYLLLRGTRVSAAWGRLDTWAKVVIGLAVDVGAIVLFYHYYTSSFFFRFSLVPIIKDQFTIEGYTMFSLKHLADVGNLLFLLFPGILVSAAYVIGAREKEKAKGPDYVFLLIFLVTSLVAVFVFDPKLGMPRDWDLLSFCGVPLVMFGFYIVLRLRAGSRTAMIASVMAITLGFGGLIPRVISQAVPRIGLTQVFDYARLDLKKNLFFLQQLHQYYWDQGQFERSPLLNFDYEKQFPEHGLLVTALELAEQGNCADAVPLFKQAITLHPTWAPPYCNLGSCYLDLGFPDSALLPLKIGNGLSPHRVLTLVNLGMAYLLTGELDEARKRFDRALDIDSDFMPARARLLELYSITGDSTKYLTLLSETADMDDAPALVNKQLGDYYFHQQQFERAREQYALAIRKGLPDEEVREILTVFPELSP